MNRALRVIVLTSAAVLLSGCDTLNALANGVTSPMTPDQSRRQVVDAATDVGHLIAKPIESAYFWHESCRDGDQGPVRGAVRISYQPPAERSSSPVMAAP